MKKYKGDFQEWVKLGRILRVENYSAVPIAKVNGRNLEVFYSSRNDLGYSVPMKAVFNFKELRLLEKTSLYPLSLGSIGDFDEHGVMPCTLINMPDGSIYMYFIGWNKGYSVPFRNALGLAISQDGGKTFEKYSDGPIMDRNPFASKFVASCEVIRYEDKFLMWYLACNEWVGSGQNLRHYYDINYAESHDGITWINKAKSVITFNNSKEYAFSTPRVLLDGKLFRMWYSYRASSKSDQYLVGYAESKNGINWVRKDNLVGLTLSEDGWDDQMVCYPSLFFFDKDLYMLYNGNNYGQKGIGLAKLKRFTN
jgi:hypothetical protein